VAPNLSGDPLGRRPYRAIFHQATEFLNRYAGIEHQVDERVNHSA
jgi:hypothetical protein